MWFKPFLLKYVRTYPASISSGEGRNSSRNWLGLGLGLMNCYLLVLPESTGIKFLGSFEQENGFSCTYTLACYISWCSTLLSVDLDPAQSELDLYREWRAWLLPKLLQYLKSPCQQTKSKCFLLFCCTGIWPSYVYVTACHSLKLEDTVQNLKTQYKKGGRLKCCFIMH